jgi:hypothetical protein
LFPRFVGVGIGGSVQTEGASLMAGVVRHAVHFSWAVLAHHAMAYQACKIAIQTP